VTKIGEHPAVTTYVAMGDSFTAGVDPSVPRWADELARSLGGDYVNLAEVGATSEHVEEEQLSRALELSPDVVTLVCGANDVLFHTRPDPDAYAARLSRMFDRLRRERPDVTIMTATYPDISRFLDLRPRSRMRVERGMKRFNEVCRLVASRHHVVVLEGFDHPIATDRSTYAEDGFHPSEEGHRAAAREFLRALRKRLRIRAAA
jgi:phosphatidylinositol alpha 1,6-mannosyltransferase